MRYSFLNVFVTAPTRADRQKNEEREERRLHDKEKEPPLAEVVDESPSTEDAEKNILKVVGVARHHSIH